MTEMKWNWDHAIQMGFEIEPVVDESTGEVTDYKGFFLYVVWAGIVVAAFPLKSVICHMVGI